MTRSWAWFFFSLLRLYKGIEVKNVQQQQLAAGAASASQTVRNYLLSVFFPSSKHQRTVEEEEEEAILRHAMPILATSCDFVRHFNLIAPRKHRNHTRSCHFVAGVAWFSLSPALLCCVCLGALTRYATTYHLLLLVLLSKNLSWSFLGPCLPRQGYCVWIHYRVYSS